MSPNGTSTANMTGREAALNELLQAEIDLRNHVEHVAEMRRALPAGPALKEYTFTDIEGRSIALRDLFAPGNKQLLLYHYMYAPDAEGPCPMCSMWCDGYDAVTPHVSRVVPFVVVAKAPHERLQALAKERGWRNIRLFSSYDTTFNTDLGAEDAKGGQIPGLSVFTKDDDGTVRHFYTKHAELTDDINRGIDLFTPVWNLLDMLPSGRGEWYPSLRYS